MRSCSSTKYPLLLETAGVTVTVPSPPGVVTVSARVVVRVVVPEVPVMVTEAAPAVAVLDAVSVSVEVVPVADAGLKLAVTPLGNPLAVKATAPVKPPVRVMAIDTVPFEPRATASVPGDAAMEKSCVTAVVVPLTGALCADCLPDASWATTVYEYVVPGLRPVSVNVVDVALPASVVPRKI